MLVLLLGDGDGDVVPGRAPQVVAIVRDFGVCSSLDLVIGRRMFSLMDLFLGDEFVIEAADRVLLFILCCIAVTWNLLDLKSFVVALEYLEFYSEE